MTKMIMIMNKIALHLKNNVTPISWAFLLAIILWSFSTAQISITSLIEGTPQAISLVKEMFPPNFSNTSEILSLLAETVAMGFWGLVFGAIGAFFLSLLAAKNISPNIFLYNISNEILNFLRAIPDIVYALVFVVSFGLGALPGVLALTLATIGLLGKFYAEAFESIDMGPIEAIESTGAKKFSVIIHSLLPQAFPLMNNYNLYMLDHNIRQAMVLGIVGAGGIGVELYTQLKYFNYEGASAIILLLLVVLVSIDRMSNYMRKSILDGSLLKGTLGFKKILFSIILVFIVTISFIYAPEDIKNIYPDILKVGDVLYESFPPNFSRFNEYTVLMGETIAMAISATVIGILFSIPLGILAANNMKVNPFITNITKEFITFLRAVPDLIFALIFVSAIGLGPFAGVLAIALHVTGFLSKFYAETIESIDMKSIEALESTGATRFYIILHGVFPQILPLFNSYNLYILDRNVRASATMGVVGAGGIGFELVMSMRLFEYQETATIVLLILAVVIFINRLSSYFRQKIV